MAETNAHKYGIDLGEGVVLNKELTEQVFLGSSYSKEADKRIINEHNWYSFSAKANNRDFWVSLCFFQGIIKRISLNGATTKHTWKPRENMYIKAENIIFLYEAFGIVDDQLYSWGKATSVFDEKDGFSGIRLSF